LPQNVVEAPRYPIRIPCRATTSSTRCGVIWLQPFKWKSVTAARHRSKSFGSDEAKPTGGPSSARRAISRNSSQSRATATSAIRPARRQSRASVVISIDRILCSPGMPSISSSKKVEVARVHDRPLCAKGGHGQPNDPSAFTTEFEVRQHLSEACFASQS